MQCPHLSENDGKIICRKMEEAGMNGEVSDFDTQHYCFSNPVNCYYFRISVGRTDLSEEKLKHEMREVSTAT